MKNCSLSFLFNMLLGAAGLLSLSCGEQQSATNSSFKTPTVANGFLVDMALEPEADGKCPNGGVTQRYFSDLNANGMFDSGEDAGHPRMYDCYMGGSEKTNPCQPGDFCNRVNLGSDQVVNCDNASESALATVLYIAELNDWATDFEKLTPKQRCYKTKEKGLATKELDIYFSREVKKADFLDYSALTALGLIHDVTINGSTPAMIPSENMAALRKIPRPYSVRLLNFDFSDHDITEILPAAGSNYIYLQGINRTNISNFSKWVFATQSTIKTILASTIIETSGPTP